MAAHVAQSVAISIFALAGLIGCSAVDGPPLCERRRAQRDSSFWKPVAPVLNLVDCPLAVEGAPPPASALTQWIGDSSGQWTIASDPAGARITSPDLSDQRDLAFLSLRLRANGAREAIATPLLNDGGQERNQRVWRSVRQVFDPVTDSDEPVVVTFDLTEAIDEVVRVLRGERPLNLVNPDVYAHRR